MVQSRRVGPWQNGSHGVPWVACSLSMLHYCVMVSKYSWNVNHHDDYDSIMMIIWMFMVEWSNDYTSCPVSKNVSGIELLWKVFSRRCIATYIAGLTEPQMWAVVEQILWVFKWTRPVRFVAGSGRQTPNVEANLLQPFVSRLGRRHLRWPVYDRSELKCRQRGSLRSWTW